MNIDLNQLDDFTPESVAQTIFTKDPLPACSCQIISEQNMDDVTYIFEILIIILMEGLEILSGDLTKANLNELTEEHIKILNPWFNSLGFNIKVACYDISEKELYNKQYCKIIIKDKLQEMFFEMKNITKNYHFTLNGDYLEQNKKKTNLKDLHTIFIINNKVFRTYFEFYYGQ